MPLHDDIGCNFRSLASLNSSKLAPANRSQLYFAALNQSLNEDSIVQLKHLRVRSFFKNLSGGADIPVCYGTMASAGGADIPVCRGTMCSAGGADIPVCHGTMGSAGGADIPVCHGTMYSLARLFKPFLKHFLTAAATLALAPIAHAQNQVERFDRQLEQIQRDIRIQVDQSVPIDQRALVDYGG